MTFFRKVARVNTVDVSDEVGFDLAYSFSSQFLRLRSIVTVCCLVMLVGVSLWHTYPIASCSVLVVSILLFVLLSALRGTLIRRIQTDSILHHFCHFTRDDVAFLTFQAESRELTRNQLLDFHLHAVERIAMYFQATLNDPSIGCAIRVAEIVDNVPQYVTWARTSNMSPQRQHLTRPIPSDKGIAHFLRQHGSRGVFMIRDIPLAVELGYWKATPTDDLSDVRTLMVAPVNGWESDQKVMFAILYVTAPRDIFRPRHVLPLKSFADILGMIYPLFARELASGATAITTTPEEIIH